jgi:hypothetical protein
MWKLWFYWYVLGVLELICRFGTDGIPYGFEFAEENS